MKHRLQLITPLVFSVLAVLPVPAAEEAVKKDPVTNALTETLSLGTQTLTVPATATINFAENATITGANFMRAALSLVVGTNVQAWDADLDTWAGVTSSANGRSLVSADYATMRDLLDLEAGINVQAFHANLAAFSGLTGAADKLPYFTGPGAMAVADFTATARELMNDATVADMRATISAARLDGANNFTTGVQRIQDTTQSFSSSTGALRVDGGVGVAKNLQVGESVVVGGDVYVDSGVIYGKVTQDGWLVGLEMATNATDAANDVDIAPGYCLGEYDPRAATRRTNISCGGYTKRLDAAWASGTNVGGLDSGSVANGTYHVHAIGGSANSEIIFSLSHDGHAPVTFTAASPTVATWVDPKGRGHGLVAGSPVRFRTFGTLPGGISSSTQYYVIATGLTSTTFQFSASVGGSAVNAPFAGFGDHYCYAGPDLTLPGSNYKYYRRIGSIVRSGGSNLAFVQDGDDFTLTTPVLDVDVSNLSTSSVTYTLASVPTGLPLLAYTNMVSSNASAHIVYVRPLTSTDQAPSATASPLSTLRGQSAGALHAQPVSIWTSPSAQIAARASGASTTFRVATLGWRDTRGQGRVFPDGL